MQLFFREYGEGSPLIILHGLFGSSDNWLTQAKLLSPSYKVYTVDLRDHGQSPHSDAFNYPSMVADLAEFIDAQNIKNPVILGHSMGGKVAMNFALTHPDKLDKLIVVDISPRRYDLEHYVIVKGLNAIPIGTLASRNEADTLLSEYVPEPDVRQFLLKNLQRKAEGGFTWKINLPLISEQLSNIGVDLHVQGTFEKPTLFIRGRFSKYIPDSDWEKITSVFPNARLETMETGHWVQAEKPQEFVDVVTRWLNA
ncbi:alpha/beta fold hydrolase [Chryseolinea lacunae]|uniref:Alpha/beta fold hydrolase n=1 Tax=Chryseolinea lacunae TaxID=2801331 RepID=A0ABS1KRX0_9BACT|nr:alpha/beta fold hydrolase [Chryseolinea lacunae]MBL0741943.1 alpha/beta fold hydrolase [Chryseolinea lacunae]